jgi:flagellar motor protein MotB
MGSPFIKIRLKNRLKTSILSFLFILFIFTPSLIWSAGFQEEKLFDGDFYSSEDLTRKIETHNREIQVIDKQIKALETDIDWLVLKINQIRDSNRTADVSLKKSIISKEKNIKTLLKSKSRLEYLVEYYSSRLDPEREQNLEKILRKALSSQKVKNITSKNIIPKVKSESDAQTALSQINNDESISKAQLQNAINNAGLNDWVEINGSGTCLRIETTLPILFPTGSAKVANEYKSFFERLAQFLKSYDVKVLVNGYADTVPIHNEKYPSNFELGATRAANIVHQLVGHGLKPSIFRIESTGKYRFAAKGMSKQKTLERRAEVTVIFSG